MRHHSPPQAQLELFHAPTGAIAPRNAQGLWSWPFFSLAKSGRVTPVDFRPDCIKLGQAVNQLAHQWLESDYRYVAYLQPERPDRNHDLPARPIIVDVRCSPWGTIDLSAPRFATSTAGPVTKASMSNITHVELAWLKKRIENCIRFGKVASNRNIDRSPRIVSFTPGCVFAFVRWTANDFGTVASRIAMLRAAVAGERCLTVAYVRPGADILLMVTGWPNVEKALNIIDDIEAIGIDSVDASPDYRRRAHSRLAVRTAPRTYIRQRYEASLLRRRIEP